LGSFQMSKKSQPGLQGSFPSISALPGPMRMGGNGPFWTTDSEFLPVTMKTRHQSASKTRITGV
jgi:hypothetical protein